MKKHRIMIVDDEESIRNSIVRALRKEDYELIAVSSGKEALELLEEKEKEIDLIMSDHLMPEMTGLEFLKKAKEKYPDILRIILTGHADVETIISSINEGEIYRFLTKPWNDEDLKITIRLSLAHLDLIRENKELHSVVKEQMDYIKILEKKHPGITTIERDESGAIIIPDE